MLTVNVAEMVSPRLVSAATLTDGSTVGVAFSEFLDAASATTAANYTVSGGLTVSGAKITQRPQQLQGAQETVVLTLSGKVTGVPTLTVNNVKDLAGDAIAPNSSLPVTASGLKALDIGALAEPSTVV